MTSRETNVIAHLDEHVTLKVKVKGWFKESAFASRFHFLLEQQNIPDDNRQQEISYKPTKSHDETFSEN